MTRSRWRRAGIGVRLLAAQALVLLVAAAAVWVVAAIVGPPLFREHLHRAGVPADSLEELAHACHDLRARVLAEEVLYIHCWGGRGRTGVVAACLLGLLYEGVDAEEALDRVQAYFATRAPGNPSPETEPQRQQVRDFYYAGYNEARPG